MGKPRKSRIGVMGPGSCPEDVFALAQEVGRRIAEEGAILICGGHGGVMAAAAKGAKEGGGITVGILPGDSEIEANPYIDIPIITGMGNARNAVNALTSQAIIAIAGSYGTLSEIALALKCGTPVVGLKTWEAVTTDGKKLPIKVANTPEEAVNLALRLSFERP